MAWAQRDCEGALNSDGGVGGSLKGGNGAQKLQANCGPGCFFGGGPCWLPSGPCFFHPDKPGIPAPPAGQPTIRKAQTHPPSSEGTVAAVVTISRIICLSTNFYLSSGCIASLVTKS